MTIYDTVFPEDLQEIDFDVVIVGTGPAGSTIAKTLSAAPGVKVCLLEAGELKPSEDSQEHYNGDWEFSWNDKIRADENICRISRLRCFGGTSNHWSGFCSPLQPFDFETRAWVPNSGWPIEYEQYSKYFRRASDTIGIPYFAESKLGEIENKWPHFSQDRSFFPNIFYQRNTSFSQKYGDDFRRAKNLTLLTNATLIAIKIDDDTVRHLVVKDRQNKQHKIRCKAVVLACGGIENARLMLNWGFGEKNKNIGRYFMGHLHWATENRPYTIWSDVNLKLYQEKFINKKGDVTFAFLNPSAKLQSDGEILNNILGLRQWSLETEGEVSDNEDDVAFEYKRFAIGAAGANNSPQGKMKALQFNISCECEPHWDSRVELTNNVDNFGLKKARVVKKFTALEAKTFLTSTLQFYRFLFSNRLGKCGIESNIGHVYENVQMGLGWHHIGTTRMGTSPKNAVIDGDCKVFGLNNLFLAGSSIFPTSGSVNPTFSIVALAHRLADKLLERIGN